LEHLFRAHELLAASDRFSEVAIVMNNIGNVYRAIGDLNSAILFFDEALSFYMDMGDTYGTLQSLSNKAAALIEADKLADAENLILQAEKLAADKAGHFAPLLRNKGVLLLKRKEYQSAENLLNMALKNTNPENHAESASSNFALGSLMTKTDRADDAIGFFEAALTADRAALYHKGIADDLAAIGAIYRGQEKNEQAVIFLKRAVKIYALIQNKQKVAETKTLLAEVSEKTDINSNITEYFVDRWLEGKILEKPCK
jgi:tetratricopeptide (TPR) repeat protein